jgi:hypothetical protein
MVDSGDGRGQLSAISCGIAKLEREEVILSKRTVSAKDFARTV